MHSGLLGNLKEVGEMSKEMGAEAHLGCPATRPSPGFADFQDTSYANGQEEGEITEGR